MKNSMFLLALGLTGCSSMMMFQSAMEDAYDKELLYQTKDGMNINLGSAGYLSFNMKDNNAYHYGITKPEQLLENIKKAEKWDVEVLKQQVDVSKEVDSYMSGLSTKYSRDSGNSYFIICWRDARYSQLIASECTLIDFKDLPAFKISLSPENIVSKTEVLKTRKSTRNNLK